MLADLTNKLEAGLVTAQKWGAGDLSRCRSDLVLEINKLPQELDTGRDPNSQKGQHPPNSPGSLLSIIHLMCNFTETYSENHRFFDTYLRKKWVVQQWFHAQVNLSSLLLVFSFPSYRQKGSICISFVCIVRITLRDLDGFCLTKVE